MALKTRARNPARSRDYTFLRGGGEMGELIRAFDWSRTPLGAPDAWPQSLRSAVSIMLPSRAAIVIFWGPDLVTIYNDAYRPALGTKHPRVLGLPARETWSELWDTGLRGLFEGVLNTGEAFWAQEHIFLLERHGYPEETYFDVSYDPIRDESGEVGGIFCIVSETTARVVGSRRLSTLRDLAARNATARTPDEACTLSMTAFAANPHDSPFAQLYLARNDALELVCATAGAERLDTAAWPLRAAARGTSERFALPPAVAYPAGAWDRPPTEALAVPLTTPGQGAPAGVLVMALNPLRPLNDDYRTFVDLAAAQVSSGIANAIAYTQERDRAEMLAGLDRAKTAFFSNVSHEFRTPLTLMLGPVDDALADGREPLPAAQRERLELVRRSGQRLQKLVNTLLDFSRIEAGRTQASFARTDLAALTTDLASTFRSAIERGGLRLVVDCPPLASSVYVDREMWEKIVLNLLSNAFKYTFEGEITVRLRQANDRVQLDVQDTGTGIPAAELPHVFDRFHRVEGARSRTHEGSGIGLALVHELVNLHGGAVTAASTVGRGSTFTVTLPLGTSHLPSDRIDAARTLATTALGAGPYVEEALRWLPDAPAPEALPLDDVVPAAPAGERRERIVWADDNADMREYVRRLLTPRYEVETVADGEAALAAIRAQRPDLVLADVMMPKLNGLELARAVRADPQTRTIPLILLSARAGDEARIEGLDAGADDYLYKPFGARELLAHVAARMEQVRSREIIRRSEERYRKIFQTAGVSLWEEDFSEVKRALDELTASGVSDLAGYIREHPDFVQRAIGLVKIRDVNQATLRLFGARSKSELMASLHDIFLPETATVFRDELIALAEGRPVFEAEEAVRTLQGERRELLINITFPEPDAGYDRVLVSLIDISDRKAAERAAREEAERMETLNRVGLSLAAEVDLERVIQAVTDAATKVSGAAFGAFFHNVTNEDGESLLLYTLSGAPREAFEKFGTPRNTAVFAPTFAGQGPVRVDDITKDPRYGRNAPGAGMPKGHLPVRSYLAVPVVSRSGEVIGGLFFGHPEPGVFTERAEQLVTGIASQAAVAVDNARLHEQRAQLIERLSESDRRKDEFLATLSHELRNPLAPLRNSLHLLRLSRSAATSRPIHEMMERQVDHLVRLVDDLLEMSRISRGTFELRKQRVEAAAIVRNAVDAADPLMQAAGHELQVSLPEAPLWLEGDPVRLAQILSNLLNNAAKYTPPGGRIALDVARHGSTAVLRVQDNGVGIPRDALPRLFEMFSRGANQALGGHGGLGIGLALARRLAEMHGGTITAASEGSGKGSVFEVRLPLAADQRAPQVPVPREAPIGAQRILVVDDNRDSADSLCMILQVLGADVRVARDGTDALAAFAAYNPAVVLLDIGMPGMDGYEVARRIRAEFPERRPLLVALTGWGQEGDRRKAEAAGFDHHLIKPADIAVLRTLLATARQS